MSSRYLLLLLFGCAGILGYANANTKRCIRKQPPIYETPDYCKERQPHLGCNHNQVNPITFIELNINDMLGFTEIRQTLQGDS